MKKKTKAFEWENYSTGGLKKDFSEYPHS